MVNRDLEKGLDFEQWLLKKWFSELGYKKNSDRYGVDLTQPGYPAIEAKRESSKRATRLPNGLLKYITVQIFVKKDNGPRELSGPWKAVKQGVDTMYIVGEKEAGSYYIVFSGMAYELAQHCDYLRQEAIDVLEGRKARPWHLRFDRDSQKVFALVELSQIAHLNRGMPWILDVLDGRD